MSASKKSVSFNLPPHIHRLHVWNFAYNQSRLGEWETAARDRCRFNHRIQQIQCILSPVLETVHRNKIFSLRFQ